MPSAVNQVHFHTYSPFGCFLFSVYKFETKKIVASTHSAWGMFMCVYMVLCMNYGKCQIQLMGMFDIIKAKRVAYVVWDYGQEFLANIRSN